MKIRVKHKETEVIVEDDGLRTDTNSNLIYNNQQYIIELIKEIVENIIKIQGDSK
jgi:hypothetical protein